MSQTFPLEAISEETLKPYDSIWAIDRDEPTFWIPVWGQDLPAKVVPYGSPAHERKQAQVLINSEDRAQLAHLLRLVKKAKGRLPRRIFHAIAVNRLNNHIKALSRDDLVEVYNELFPADPIRETPDLDGDTVLNRVLDHVRHGLDAEEIVDLWNVMFPGEENLHYDTEAGQLVFDEPSEFSSVLD
jgi:hypothetical protein